MVAGHTLVMSLRTHARLCIALFIVSAAFPVVAGVLNRSRPSPWLGGADVAIAAILFCTTAILATRAQPAITDAHRVAALRVTHRLILLIPVLLVAYFLVGSRIDWTVLVIGLAWRGWLALYSLPAVMAALDSGRASREHAA
ncbi:MAG: hypothetical protein M3Z10_04600 [Gemmatimonadota bacterium]|nr:hypothetical protein [Gemmatimonadota bacterium]